MGKVCSEAWRRGRVRDRTCAWPRGKCWRSSPHGDRGRVAGRWEPKPSWAIHWLQRRDRLQSIELSDQPSWRALAPMLGSTLLGRRRALRGACGGQRAGSTASCSRRLT